MGMVLVNGKSVTADGQFSGHQAVDIRPAATVVGGAIVYGAIMAV